MLFLKRYADLDDDRLVQLTAEGDERAFRTLVERHQGVVLDYAWRFLGDAQEARDVAQETLLRVYRGAAAYRPNNTFRAWAVRIARNLCLDHVRKKRPLLMEQLPEQADDETPLTAAPAQRGRPGPVQGGAQAARGPAYGAHPAPQRGHALRADRRGHGHHRERGGVAARSRPQGTARHHRPGLRLIGLPFFLRRLSGRPAL